MNAITRLLNTPLPTFSKLAERLEEPSIQRLLPTATSAVTKFIRSNPSGGRLAVLEYRDADFLPLPFSLPASWSGQACGTRGADVRGLRQNPRRQEHFARELRQAIAPALREAGLQIAELQLFERHRFERGFTFELLLRPNPTADAFEASSPAA